MEVFPCRNLSQKSHWQYDPLWRLRAFFFLPRDNQIHPFFILFPQSSAFVSLIIIIAIQGVEQHQSIWKEEVGGGRKANLFCLSGVLCTASLRLQNHLFSDRCRIPTVTRSEIQLACVCDACSVLSSRDSLFVTS